MRKGFKEQAGVSWSDVLEWWRLFEKEHVCRLDITISVVSLAANGRPYLKLKGTAYAGLLSAGLSWRREYSLNWPAYGTRTMAGLYLRLIHEMGEDLVERPPKPGKAWKSLIAPLC